MKPVLLSFVLALGLSSTSAHKFEDGFVERTMAIVVRDKTATVEYSVGLNAKTMRDVLDQWEADSHKPGSTNPTASAAQGVAGSSPPAEPNSEAYTQDTKSKKVGNQRQADSTSPKPLSKQGTSSNPDSESLLGMGINPDDESAHKIDAELYARFKKLAPNEIANRIAVTCDGQRVVPGSVTAGPTPLHPFLLVVKFEFKLPASEGIDLKIRDQNFPGNSGAVRYALKTKGNSMLLKSNKAPILVRSERVELTDLTPKKQEQLTTIAARLAIIGDNP